jgi:hypothetical protein
MRKIKEVLRLRFELGLGQRQIGRSCGMGWARLVLGPVHALGTTEPYRRSGH